MITVELIRGSDYEYRIRTRGNPDWVKQFKAYVEMTAPLDYKYDPDLPILNFKADMTAVNVKGEMLNCPDRVLVKVERHDESSTRLYFEREEEAIASLKKEAEDCKQKARKIEDLIKWLQY
jgi:hypothetical protein